MKTGKLSRLPRAEQWATRICTQLGKSVEAIIEVGRLLVKAKADLEHGEWGRLFEDELLPFGQGSAERLMKIAEHPQLSNSANSPILPPSWTSLYELTKVEPKRLSAAFKDGIIVPDMKGRDVKALMPPKKKRSKSPRVASSGEFSPSTRCYFDIETRLRATVFDLNAEDQRDLFDSVQQLLATLAGEAQRRTA